MSDFVSQLVNSIFWEHMLRLLVAGLCGAMIGFERKSRHKEAGLRTHFVVALGSALVMLVSKYGFYDVVQEHGGVLDPSRVAAQIVSGIGFLGAGTIIVQRQAVRGLTTAAGLWTTAGIGMAIGAGMYGAGFGATVLVLIGLETFDRGTRVFRPQKPVQLLVRFRDVDLAVSELLALIELHHGEVSRVSSVSNDNEDKVTGRLEFQIRFRQDQSADAVFLNVRTLPGFLSVERVTDFRIAEREAN